MTECPALQMFRITFNDPRNQRKAIDNQSNRTVMTAKEPSAVSPLVGSSVPKKGEAEQMGNMLANRGKAQQAWTLSLSQLTRVYRPQMRCP